MICPLKARNIKVNNIGDGEQSVSVLNAYITQGYGYTNFVRDKKPYGVHKDGTPLPHTGLDFRASTGTVVFAPFSGVAIVVKSTTGYGNHIRIKSDKWECVLAHLSSFLINNGDSVKIGDPIGKVGSTGNSTASHLHFGIRPLINGGILNYDDKFFGYIDPSPFLIEWWGTIKNQSNYSGLTNTMLESAIMNRPLF